jgi:hypothetical protein
MRAGRRCSRGRGITARARRRRRGSPCRGRPLASRRVYGCAVRTRPPRVILEGERPRPRAWLRSGTARERGRARPRTASGRRGDDVERFVRAYYANAYRRPRRPQRLDVYGADSAPRQARPLPGELKVHVYNPDVEEHGWDSPYTVVETVIADMPFLVDSVTMEVTRHGSAMHLVARRSCPAATRGRLLEVGGEDGKPVADPRRDRLDHRPGDARTASRRPRARARRRRRGGRGLAGDARRGAWAIAELEQSLPPIPSQSSKRRAAAVDARRPLHALATASTRSARGRRGRSPRSTEPVSASSASTRAAPLTQLLEADTGGAQARARRRC